MVFCLQAAGGELLDKADELFKRADVDKNGTVDKDEFVNILGTLEESYPQIATLTKGAADGMLHDILSKFDEDGDGEFILICVWAIRLTWFFFNRESGPT